MNKYEYISSARKKGRITQKELSEQTGISLRTIQRIESGEVNPRPFTIKRIEEVLGITENPVNMKKEDANNYYVIFKWLFASSLFLPVLYSFIALAYWKRLEKQIRHPLRGLIYFNLFSACIALPVLVVVTAMILRSFNVPTTIRFLPIYVPIYWFFATINLLGTLRVLHLKHTKKSTF